MMENNTPNNINLDDIDACTFDPEESSLSKAWGEMTFWADALEKAKEDFNNVKNANERKINGK